MIFYFILLCLFCVRSCVDSETAIPDIIPEKTAELKHFPYQLALERLYDKKNFVHTCGATIIHKQWAITLATCVIQDGDIPKMALSEGGGTAGGSGAGQHRVSKLHNKEIRLRSGSSSREKGGTLHYVEKIIVHPQFNSFNHDYDVAVIKVSNPFSGVVKKIQMVKESPYVGTKAVVSGWGGFPTVSQQLRQAKVIIKDSNLCKKNIFMTETMLCVGERACVGDPGGPLVNNELVGIVSKDWNCGVPTVFTDVAQVSNWVYSTIKKN